MHHPQLESRCCLSAAPDDLAQDVPGRAAKPEEHTNKLQSFIVRTASTIALIGMMILFIYLGHIFLVSLIFSIQVSFTAPRIACVLREHSKCRQFPDDLPSACHQFLMVGELFKMARVAQESRALPGFRAQQWYFFFVATFYMYGR